MNFRGFATGLLFLGIAGIAGFGIPEAQAQDAQLTPRQQVLLQVLVDDSPGMIYQLIADLNVETSEIVKLRYLSEQNPKYPPLEFEISDLKKGVVVKKALSEPATTLMFNPGAERPFSSKEGGELQVSIMREKSFIGKSEYRVLPFEVVRSGKDWKLFARIDGRRIEFSKLFFSIWISGDKNPKDLNPSPPGVLPKGVKLIEFYKTLSSETRSDVINTDSLAVYEKKKD